MKDTHDLGRFHLPIKVDARSVTIILSSNCFGANADFNSLNFAFPSLDFRNTHFSLNNVRSCTLRDKYTACNKETKG